MIGLGSFGAAFNSAARQLMPMPRGPQPKRVRITAGPPKPLTKLLWLIRVCPGGSHGIFQSNVGPVRKPFTEETIEWGPEASAAA